MPLSTSRGKVGWPGSACSATEVIAGVFVRRKEGRREAKGPRVEVGVVVAVGADAGGSSPSLDIELRLSISFPSLIGGDVVIRRSDV